MTNILQLPADASRMARLNHWHENTEGNTIVASPPTVSPPEAATDARIATTDEVLPTSSIGTTAMEQGEVAREHPLSVAINTKDSKHQQDKAFKEEPNGNTIAAAAAAAAAASEEESRMEKLQQQQEQQDRVAQVQLPTIQPLASSISIEAQKQPQPRGQIGRAHV